MYCCGGNKPRGLLVLLLLGSQGKHCLSLAESGVALYSNQPCSLSACPAAPSPPSSSMGAAKASPAGLLWKEENGEETTLALPGLQLNTWAHWTCSIIRASPWLLGKPWCCRDLMGDGVQSAGKLLMPRDLRATSLKWTRAGTKMQPPLWQQPGLVRLRGFLRACQEHSSHTCL